MGCCCSCCCSSKKQDNQQNLVYQRLINNIFNIQQQKNQSGQQGSEQFINITDKNQSQIELEFTQKVDRLQSIEAHIKITYKALRDHLQDNQLRLTDSVIYIDELLQKNINNPYQMFISLKLLDCLSGDMDKFTQNLKMKKQFQDDEPSRNVSVINISNQGKSQVTTTDRGNQDMLFLSDNFIQFENHYLQILNQIFSKSAVMQQYCIESILKYSKNRKQYLQSETVYNILQQLIKLVQVEFESLQTSKFSSQKQLENYKILIDGFQSTCQKLPLGQHFFENITENILLFVFNLIIIMNKEDQKQQNNVKSNKNNNVSDNKNPQIIIDDINLELAQTDTSDKHNIFKTISNQCYEMIGTYAQRAFIQKSYGKLLNPFFKLFDQLEWDDNLDIERIITMTIQISIKESVQLNYEVYLLGKIIGYIGSGGNVNQKHDTQMKQMQSICLQQQQGGQIQNIDEIIYKFKNSDKPFIKIRSLKLLGRLLHRDKKDQYFLYFQLEKVLDAIILTITTEIEYEYDGSQQNQKVKEDEYKLYKNQQVVKQVKQTFKQLVSGLAPDSRSLIDVISYLSNAIYQDIYNQVVDDQEDFDIQQNIIFDLIDICLQLVNQFSQSNAIRDEIILNFILIQQEKQFRIKSFIVLEQLINAQLMSNNNNNTMIKESSGDIIKENYNYDVTPSKNNQNNYEINEQYFILYDNSMKFIFATFLHNINQCEFSTIEDINIISQITWRINMICNKVLSRQDQYNFKHLKFLIVSFGIVILKELLQYFNSDNKNNHGNNENFENNKNSNTNSISIQNSNTKIMKMEESEKKIECKKFIFNTLLATIAHSSVCKDMKLMNTPNQSPKSQFKDIYQNIDSKKEDNDNLSYDFNQNYNNFKYFQEYVVFENQFKEIFQQNSKNLNMNINNDQQLINQSNQLLEQLVSLDENNKQHIQGVQFKECVQNYKKEIADWKEKVFGDNMNDITDEIFTGQQGNHHSINGLNSMGRSNQKRQSFNKIHHHQANGTQRDSQNHNNKPISSFQQIQHQVNIVQNQNQNPVDTSFDDICKYIKQKKVKKQIVDLNEMDIDQI